MKVVIELQGNGHPRFYELLREIGELHDRKNSDYSSRQDPLSNFRECQGFVDPWIGCLIRLTDKYSRIKRLAEKVVKGEEVGVKSESIKDTLMDLAVYALIDIILFEEAQK